MKVQLKNLGSDRLTCNMENTTDQDCSRLRLVWGGRVFELGDLAAKEYKSVALEAKQGIPLGDFLLRVNANNYQSTVQQRGRAFGGTTSGRIDNQADGCFVATFLGALDSNAQYTQFAAPPGTDLTFALRDNAILLAYAEGQAAEPRMNDFTARRGQVNTFWRIPIPLNAPSRSFP